MNEWRSQEVIDKAPKVISWPEIWLAAGIWVLGVAAVQLASIGVLAVFAHCVRTEAAWCRLLF